MGKEYTTISVSNDIFNELYLLKATLLRGNRDKSWNVFMYMVMEILEDYINTR